MKLVLASNNKGKLAELQALFAPLGVELVRQADLGIPEAPEPHRTFIENALAKARHASQVSGLPALADAVFGHARPATVVVTTPNVEYNVRYEGLTGMRHHDHRFEWNRATFAAWCAGIAADYGYSVDVTGVGDADPEVGAPTQMAVFSS